MLFYYALFEYIWGFFVQPLQLSFESSVFEYLECVGIGIFDIFFRAVCYWLSKDGIAVKVEENMEVIVAADGWYEKLTCLISAYCSNDGLTINVSVMNINTFCFFVWIQIWRWRGGRHVCYCVIDGCIIILFLIFVNDMNGIGC